MASPARHPHAPRPRPERLWWLIPAVLLINLGAVGLLFVYSMLNLRPFLPGHEISHIQLAGTVSLHAAVLLPAALGAVYLWPLLRGLRLLRTGEPGRYPAPWIERAARAPLVLAALSLATWLLLDGFLIARVLSVFEHLTPGTWAHLVIRPLLAGLIAATAVFFAAEHLCRTHLWPLLFASTPIEGNPRLWKIRVGHRLFLLWMAISFLPLGAIALTAFIRIEGLEDPIHRQVMWAILLIGASGSLGGAWLAWLLTRAMSRPLRDLEGAMGRLRGGDFSVRERVGSTDEIGALAGGFNLMAGRLAESYQALEARNRELAGALERVAFLESVKRGLDRFVPDTVRRLIEENPDSPSLDKAPKDVTVLFLDIEGYTRLSEQLPREELSQLVERYFSLYLSDIRREGGDINETAGDGLMILFQEPPPDAHAAAAVRAALAVRAKTQAANQEAPDRHPPIAVNIGIASGECHVGSTRLQGVAGERWTFTATGPVTNLAARLRDQARQGQILLSADTARRTREGFRLRSLGPLALKNIAAPVETWEAEGEIAAPAARSGEA